MHAYRVHYRTGEQNYCPGCGRSHWIVGRFSAECAFCNTAVEIKNSRGRGVGLVWKAAA